MTSETHEEHWDKTLNKRRTSGTEELVSPAFPCCFNRVQRLQNWKFSSKVLKLIVVLSEGNRFGGRDWKYHM
jgi:hypothetical protein